MSLDISHILYGVIAKADSGLRDRVSRETFAKDFFQECQFFGISYWFDLDEDHMRWCIVHQAEALYNLAP